MTQRGNEGKSAVTVYADPQVHRQFKANCALVGLSMSEVLEAFMADEKKSKQFIIDYMKQS